MALLHAFGISHGVMLDDDLNKNHHVLMNDFIDQCKNEHTLAKPFRFPDCLERFLTLDVVKSPDKKPVEMLKAIATPGRIPEQSLAELRKAFCQVLAIEDDNVTVPIDPVAFDVNNAPEQVHISSRSLATE